ncbi:hypothetical protein MTR62_19420, partial [Novosphingobium sp. 1949]|nr:hypothetical protein [Novosphingobium organovorum]
MRVVPALPDSPLRPESPRWPTGIATLDAALGGGFAQGCVHEIYAAEPADAAAAAGFSAALASGMSGRADGRAGPGTGRGQRAVLWLRARRSVQAAGLLQGRGWAELGGAPELGLVGVVPDTLALLRAGVDALRHAPLGAVIVEGCGAMRELDLTASRRLVLAAQGSGVPLLLLRLDASPAPSAAQT